MRRRHPKRTVTRDIRTRRPIHPGREIDELEAVSWPDSVRVRSCMTKRVVTARADALVWAAAETMRREKIRHLPIVDEEERLIGIVTDRDLRQVIFDPAMQERVGKGAEALGQLPVRDVMTWGVVTTRPQAEIRDAARLMHEQKIGALQVVEDGHVIGMLTESDVLKAFENVLGEGVLAKPYRWAFAYR